MKVICLIFTYFIFVSNVFCQNEAKSKWSYETINTEINKLGTKSKLLKEDCEIIVEKSSFVDEALRIAESSKTVSDEYQIIILKIEILINKCSEITDDRSKLYLERIKKIKTCFGSDIKKSDVLNRFENYLKEMPDDVLIENTLQQISKELKIKDKNNELYQKTMALLSQKENTEFLLSYEKDYSKRFPDVYKLLKDLDKKLKK